MHRRSLIGAAMVLPWAARAQNADAQAKIRTGGVVVAFRHALAPGTFDPPEFRLGDCTTQRNLNDVGRAQAQRLGQWFRQQGLSPAAVRSSPWCRCMDTATLAFDQAQAWPALGSPRGTSPEAYADNLKTLRQALADVAARPGRFEVWVTHMFVLSDLVGGGVSSGDGLVLAAGVDGQPQLLARLAGL
ncbi:MAG: histidine phosphatase family protein [Rubrivivax sp.]|nr:histidine phosphatase family protein [Rubrivivax sp.]MDH5338180.1 histidine phosphatase family protein [Rubrivivax sp.]